jgi:hypothetical protein
MHKTGGMLAEWPSRVHESGGFGINSRLVICRKPILKAFVSALGSYAKSGKRATRHYIEEPFQLVRRLFRPHRGINTVFPHNLGFLLIFFVSTFLKNMMLEERIH